MLTRKAHSHSAAHVAMHTDVGNGHMVTAKKFLGLFGDSALCHLLAPLQQAFRLGKFLWMAVVWAKSGLACDVLRLPAASESSLTFSEAIYRVLLSGGPPMIVGCTKVTGGPSRLWGKW